MSARVPLTVFSCRPAVRDDPAVRRTAGFDLDEDDGLLLADLAEVELQELAGVVAGKPGPVTS